ncbi:hypothetical protein LRQ04_01755 [Paenarthrobacter sp. AR 02]|uniref:hypothetical protein n=1 Tax=Paenarthrobacter sp. AR 02 TaxID=2899821 RepID=UPI001F1B3BD3|nr:hypothetical protein [Paenarthrobacter sp. AR 02]MCF3137967.1 hypothetical protein [Paenarthrobacter sp. AR 02]
MSENSARPLPAGRHFKRRRFNLHIPASAPRRAPAGPIQRPSGAVVAGSAKEPDQQFKRRVALVLVILAVLAIPALLTALLLAG